jgi:hypothetical protein
MVPHVAGMGRSFLLRQFFFLPLLLGVVNKCLSIGLFALFFALFFALCFF